MKRFLTIVLLIILFIVAVTVPFLILGGQRFAIFSDQEKAVTTVILATLELVGIVISIVIVVIILYQYFRYRRPYRLVFDAFSNESALFDADKKPLNLSILAQEELERRFKIIYNELSGFSDKKKKSQDLEALVADELYIEEEDSENDLGMYVSADQINKSGMIEDLKDVIRYLKDSKGMNLISLIGEIAPKEAVPVMKFIEAFIPPHVIKATGYLQWRSEKAEKVGMTFKYEDLSNQRNLMVRTIWWQSRDKTETSASIQTTVASTAANDTLTNKESEHYIELLSPAMQWMALMFWEQKLISHVPFTYRILKTPEKRRQARILYLLGALYYAYADQHQPYKDFFCQLAVEHFRQAIVKDLNWYLPYKYLADLYSFKMQYTEEDKGKKLLDKALSLYDAACYLAIKRSNDTQNRIRIARALAKLVAKDWKLIKEAEDEVQDLISQDPANFDPDRADCGKYLYSLAYWYVLAEKFHPTYIDNAEQKARLYVAYCLARSANLWDAIKNNDYFKFICGEEGLKALKQILDEKQGEETQLCKLKSDDFKKAIDEVLREVAMKVTAWVVDEDA